MILQITEQHHALIENIIKANSRFSGNEDLLEDFCSETLKRGYNIITSINNVNNIEQYLRKVANSAIIEVLRTSGRIRRTNGGYAKSPEITTPILSPQRNSFETTLNNPIYEIPDPKPNFEDQLISEEQVNAIYSLLKEIDSSDVEKKYLELFTERYVNNKKQSEIAAKFNISQGEVSKRILRVAQEIQKRIEG